MRSDEPKSRLLSSGPFDLSERYESRAIFIPARPRKRSQPTSCPGTTLVQLLPLSGKIEQLWASHVTPYVSAHLTIQPGLDCKIEMLFERQAR